MVDSQGPVGAGVGAGVEAGDVTQAAENELVSEEEEELEDASAPAPDSMEHAFSRRLGLKGKMKKSIRRPRLLE